MLEEQKRICDKLEELRAKRDEINLQIGDLASRRLAYLLAEEGAN